MICAGVALAPSGIVGAVGTTHWSWAIAGAVSAMKKVLLNRISRIMCLSSQPMADGFLHPETMRLLHRSSLIQLT
jgi:hypothetical protein